MTFETTVRAFEDMAVPYSWESASATGFGCPVGSDKFDYATTFDFVADEVQQHSSWPSVESPVPSSAPTFTLSPFHFLKDSNTVLWTPLDELLGCSVAEVLGSSCLLALKPFEDTDDAFSVLALCLSLGEFSLQSLDGLVSSLVECASLDTRNEEFSVSVIYGDYDVGFVKVNTDWPDTFDLIYLSFDTDITYEFAVPFFNDHAIYTDGIIESGPEVIWDMVVEMFSALNRPYTQRPILSEVCIPATFTDEEKCKGGFELEGGFDFVVIRASRKIRCSSQTYCRACQLGINTSFDLPIGFLMQRQCLKGLTAIETSSGYVITDSGKLIKGFSQPWVIFDYHLNRSFAHHTYIFTTKCLNTLINSGGEVGIPPPYK